MKATLLATFGKQRMLTSSTAPSWHASSILLATVEDSVKVEFSDFFCIGGMYRRLLRRNLAFQGSCEQKFTSTRMPAFPALVGAVLP